MLFLFILYYFYIDKYLVIRIYMSCNSSKLKYKYLVDHIRLQSLFRYNIILS